MQATITYELTESAQRAAMRATGQPVARYQEMVIEVPVEDLELFPIDKLGNIKLALDGFHPPQAWARALHAAGWAAVGFNGSGLEAATINPPLIEDYKRGAVIVTEQDAAEAELKRRNGEHNQRVTEVAYQVFLSEPEARVDNARALLDDDLLCTPADWWPSDHAALVAEVKRRQELDAAARRAAVKAKEEAEKAKEQAKQDYIDSWLSAATPALLEQYKAGLLARNEVLRLIADNAFNDARLPEAHKVILCNDEDCACGIPDAATIPPRVYAAWQAITKLLPEGARVQFEKARDCLRDADGYHEPDNDGAGPVYYTAMIKLPVGPFIFERRVAVSNG